jgi:hypothetical protein
MFSYQTSRLKLSGHKVVKTSSFTRKPIGLSNIHCKLQDRAFGIGDAVEAMWIGDDGWYPGRNPALFEERNVMIPVVIKTEND